MKTYLLFITILLSTFSFADNYKAKKALSAPIIDGNDNDACWTSAPWSAINQVWDPQNSIAGTPDDFTGHYKAVWTSSKLYVLMRITDDKLTFWTENKDPLVDYYKTDCPEIFIDENHSKGDHRCNYNAFAYHISMIYDVVDSDKNCQPQLYKDVLQGARIKIGNTYYWEFAINVFTDQYVFGAANNPKANLVEGKIMGFSAAYNDSDDTWDRERMYGSQLISPPDPTYGTNVSYVNANYFGTIELVAADITTGLNFDNYPEGINIFPNPVSDKLSIESETEISQLTLKDSKGIILYSNKIPSQSYELDVSKLNSGIYFLLLETDKKLLKRKLEVK